MKTLPKFNPFAEEEDWEPDEDAPATQCLINALGFNPDLSPELFEEREVTASDLAERIDWIVAGSKKLKDPHAATKKIYDWVRGSAEKIYQSTLDSLLAKAEAEESKKSNKHSKKTKIENPMPNNNTSEKVGKGDFLKHYMTARGANRVTMTQLVELAMEEYPGWKEETIRNYINWLKSSTRKGGLQAEGEASTLLPETGALEEKKSEKAANPPKGKRSSYLSTTYMRLDTRPIKIWGYDGSEKFVCRLEINAAGLSVYAGEKGGKKLCDFTWERLVVQLSKP